MSIGKEQERTLDGFFRSTEMGLSMSPSVQSARDLAGSIHGPGSSRVGTPKRVLSWVIGLCFLICEMVTMTLNSLKIPRPVPLPHHTSSFLYHFWEINMRFFFSLRIFHLPGELRRLLQGSLWRRRDTVGGRMDSESRMPVDQSSPPLQREQRGAGRKAGRETRPHCPRCHMPP